MDHLDYLVEKTGGRTIIEHITAPRDFFPFGQLPAIMQVQRARILIEIFHGRWPSEN